MSVTYKYRMILTIAVIERQIVLVDIGSHDDVYRQIANERVGARCLGVLHSRRVTPPWKQDNPELRASA